MRKKSKPAVAFPAKPAVDEIDGLPVEAKSAWNLKKPQPDHVKLGRLSLEKATYDAIRDQIGLAAETYEASMKGTLDVGYIVHGLQEQYPNLGLGEITEMLQQLKQPLGAARLSQLGKIARYVPRELLVPGKTAEDYYAVVLHCDKVVKLHEPTRTRHQPEPAARMLVKGAIDLLQRGGRGELARRLKRETDKLQRPKIEELLSNPLDAEFAPGWTTVRGGTLPIPLASIDTATVDCIQSTTQAFKSVPMGAFLRVLDLSGRIELRPELGNAEAIVERFTDGDQNILIVNGNEASLVVRKKAKS